MGDWDVGAFDNDTAKDWLQTLVEGESTAPIFRALVTVAKLPQSDYLQAPDCECAIAAAELVVAARGRPSGSLPMDAASWLETRKFVAGTEVVNMALAVLKRILDKSELKEVWEDTDSTRDWLNSVLDLQKRLEDSAEDLAATVIVDRNQEEEDSEELFRHALELAAQGNHDSAVSVYDRVIEIKPDMSIAYLGRGTAHLEQGDYRKAVKDISQSIRLDPDVPEAYYLRAEALFRLAEYEQALEDLDLLIKAEPDRPEALWKRGLTLQRMGNYMNAADDFSLVIESGINTREAYERRAECYEHLGKQELAARDRELAKNDRSSQVKDRVDQQAGKGANSSEAAASARGKNPQPGAKVPPASAGKEKSTTSSARNRLEEAKSTAKEKGKD